MEYYWSSCIRSLVIGCLASNDDEEEDGEEVVEEESCV